MSEAFRIIAAQQQEQRLRRMVAYVRQHNPALSEDEAQAISLLAVIEYGSGGIAHTAPKGYFTEKAKELAHTFTDPDALGKWRDERDRKRWAPVERAHNEIKMREHRERVRKELGQDIAPGKTVDDRLKGMYDYIQQRRQKNPAPEDTLPPPPEATHGREGDPESMHSSAPDKQAPSLAERIEQLRQTLTQSAGEGG